MSDASTPARALARRPLFALALSLAAACGDPSGPSAGNDGGETGGEVLGPPVTAGMFDVGGQNNACGVTVAGKAYCWGDRALRGIEPVSEPGSLRYSPRSAAVGLVLASISSADYSTCALTLDGTAYCWGVNTVGQLGNGSTSAAPIWSPQAVVGGHKFVRLEHNGSAVYALTAAGKLFAWGSNVGNALGDGTTTDRSTPVPIAAEKTFSTFASGPGVTIALDTAGVAWSWGAGYAGNFFEGWPGSATPAVLASVSTRRFRAVAGGGLNFVFVTTAGEMLAQGVNPSGGYYNGTVAVAPGLVFTKVATSYFSHMGLTAEGRLYVWGRNHFGQVGDGTTTRRPSPVAIGGALRFRDISAHDEFSAALTTDGELYFWGRNADGIFGNGAASPKMTTPFSAVPVGPRARGLSLTISPASPTINAGETLDLILSVTRVGGGFATSGVNVGLPGDVTISVRDLPSGITASFPTSATITATQMGTVLRLRAGSGITGGVGNFGIRAQASNMPTQPVQPMSVLKVSASGSTGLDLVCTSSATPSSFPDGYHCMTNSAGGVVPGKFAIPTLTSSPWWVDETASVCVSWRNDANLGRSTARFKAGLGGGATTVTEGHWGLLVGRAGLLEGVPGARYLFTSNLDAQTRLLTMNDLASDDVINNYAFQPRATCPW